MRYLTRAEWGAEFDVNLRRLMALPAPDLWIHHTVTYPSADPAADMRAIERIDIGRFGYPSYSWVIHPSGTVLEGMGVHVGAHTINHNSTSFGVSFVGNFEYDTPTDAAMDACRELIAMLHGNGWLAAGDQPTGGHRDVYATACPGRNLYPRIPELRVPPAPPPASEHDDMLNVIYNNTQNLLHAGKLMYCTVPLPDAVPKHFVDKVQWDLYVRAFGQPVK